MTSPDRTDPAGTGSPAPAVSSAPPVDVVPEDARRELERVRTRWSQLSLDRAEAALPLVQAVVEAVAARTSDREVPEVGAPVVIDQLAVVVWDACAAGRGEGLADALAQLRRDLP